MVCIYLNPNFTPKGDHVIILNARKSVAPEYLNTEKLVEKTRRSHFLFTHFKVLRYQHDETLFRLFDVSFSFLVMNY